MEIGKEADFIILDRNIFKIAPTEIKETKVDETYLSGQLIFER